ncbi:unnamed protein product [Rotaria socialis]|uniref:TTF-type domain-containing protein n=1 Tax=Rotaria socialis TaxID=392032 RepID=A0A817NY80_9BILA|nr:unnamed protein product [Rotaria socialis]
MRSAALITFSLEQEASSSSLICIEQHETSSSCIGKEQQGTCSSSSSLTAAGVRQEILISSIIEEQQETTITSLSNQEEQISSSSFLKSQLLNVNDISGSCYEGPTQPKLVSYPINKDKRCFRSEWFLKFSWLEYSIENDLTFCYYCRHFFNGSNLNNRDQCDSFLRGFCKWKRAFCRKQGFLKHQSRRSHIIAEKNHKEYIIRTKSGSSIVQVIDKSRNEIIKNNRQRLMKIISALHLCARQMISIRGHDESEESSNCGNFVKLLRWSSTTDPICSAILDDSA